MVFRATLRRGMGKTFTVAVKTAKKSTSEKERSEFLREMNIMAQMRHPNIVQLHGIIRDGEYYLWQVCIYIFIFILMMSGVGASYSGRHHGIMHYLLLPSKIIPICREKCYFVLFNMFLLQKLYPSFSSSVFHKKNYYSVVVG